MIRLDFKRQPRWPDLGHGGRVHVRPCTTALTMTADDPRWRRMPVPGRAGVLTDDCPPERVAACAAEMERPSHDMARKILVTLFAVDIDDARSVEEFRNRRHRKLKPSWRR